MKKRGSILIEALAACIILMAGSTFIIKAYCDSVKSVKERILKESLIEDINNIECEFKYNMSMKDINDILVNDEVSFNDDGNISKKLTMCSVKDLQRGNDIKVKKCGENSTGIIFFIEGSKEKDNVEAESEKEFTKSWWMYE